MAHIRPSQYRPMRNVQRVRRALCDGRHNYHYYHRPTRTKLPGQPGSPDFIAAYQKCEQLVRASVSTRVRGNSDKPEPMVTSPSNYSKECD
jgi:hypothetical protein